MATYSNSSLATPYNWGTKNSNPRVNNQYNPTGEITKITIHHMAGKMSAKACADMHHNGNKSSANYYVGYDGKISCGVDESRRAWTSSSPTNDYKAITIEVSNIKGEPNWEVSDEALNATIALCVDICKRNGIKKINYTGDKNGNLTMHCWFTATKCPGPYLKGKFSYIAQEINKKLNESVTVKPSDNKPSTNVQPAPATQVLYRVQCGAFKNKDNALALQAKLKAKKYDTYIFLSNDGLYKIQLGAFKDRQNAERLSVALKFDGFDSIIVRR